MMDFAKLDVAEAKAEHVWPLPTSFVDGLERVGDSPHSDVGGSGQQRTGEGSAPDDRTVVQFWGICDIKFDPREDKEKRVMLLELGDGRTSRFSHHGRHIKERFDRDYRVDSSPIKRAVMVENKKFTHDMFVQGGFSHLRPATGCYPRHYTPVLADQIIKDLELKETRLAVVLKLCNRSRGAGVVVCSAEQLDATLHRLLTPPASFEIEPWLDAQADQVLHPKVGDILDEHCLHWWSNECPLFVAERCCKSIPVEMLSGSGELFDGTLRVAFALYRRPSEDADADRHRIQPFEVDWLGGYWKLPRVAIGTREASAATLEELHGQVVSSFNSVEKRTAEVAEEDLKEVYEALAPALPRIFHSGALSVTTIMCSYREEPLFCAFALARAAAGIRPTNLKKAVSLLVLAKRTLGKEPLSLERLSLPELSVLSYIQRNEAVCEVMQKNWDKGALGFQISRWTLPTNATAYYLEGCCLQEKGLYEDAVVCLRRSLALDPDFRSPHINLGTCYMHLGDHVEAIRSSIACLHRHPDSPSAQFNAGQALYHLLHQGAFQDFQIETVCSKARRALEIAQERMPDYWQMTDSRMLEYVVADAGTRECMLEEDVHGWKSWFFRP